MKTALSTLAMIALAGCGGAGEAGGAADEGEPLGRAALAECDVPSAVEIDSRLHSCQKIPYSSIGTLLKGRGVDLAKTGTPDTAGELYAGARDSFGVAKADSRLGEKSFHTTAGATRLFDVFLQAAPEIIANIGDPAKAPACTYNGANKPMFDAATGACVEDSVSCLLGRPAEQDDMILCDEVLANAAPNDAADLAIKQRIAVALILSAGHTCE